MGSPLKRHQAQRSFARTGFLSAGLAFMIVLGAGHLLCFAQEVNVDEIDNPYLWKPRVKSVAVFKNGLGFFMREGDVELRDGWAVARHIPPAAFGTLAIYSHNKNEMVDIVGAGPGEIVDFDGRDAPKDLASKRKRLESCKNLRVELSYKRKGTKLSAAGTLISVGTEFVVLETDSSNFAVPVETISRLQVLDLPMRVHLASDGGRVPRRTKLGMAYLRKGITWIPEYTLRVIDEETAELTLRGTLVNEAEDMVHCDVHFVVGVPHFEHVGYMAPIAVGRVVRTIGTAVAPRQVQTQIMNRAAIVQNIRRADQFKVVERPVAPAGGDVAAKLGNLPKMEGPGGTDYTVYTKKDLTVRRGEKAIVTLFVKTIKYSHRYEWNTNDRIRHYMVLHNSTDTAWTTGPCLAVSEEHPLTEDLLKYTPKGGSGELPVTTAINIAHKKSESEIDRKLKAHQPSHNFWVDLVTVRGELKLRNFEKKTADVTVVAPVPGKPVSASDGGTLEADPTKLKLLERAGKITWRLKLEPGETKTLTYTYERFVPSR